MWFQKCLVCSLKRFCLQFLTSNDSPNYYINSQTWLYAAYAEFCAGSGNKPVGCTRFIKLLDDLLKAQLKIPDVTHSRDRQGGYFKGIKIRTEAPRRTWQDDRLDAHRAKEAKKPKRELPTKIGVGVLVEAVDGFLGEISSSTPSGEWIVYGVADHLSEMKYRRYFESELKIVG